MRTCVLASLGGMAALAAMLVAGCTEKRPAQPARDTPAANASAPLDGRVGWLHARCLAIANAAVPRDGSVTIVTLGDSQTIVEARIIGPTASSETCPALLDDRRAANTGKSSFYEVRTPQGIGIELGIGVIGDVAREGGGLDITGDGVADHFTQCATSEGVSFAVWSGAPYQGTAVWSAYYYLGYDTESTCPPADR